MPVFYSRDHITLFSGSAEKLPLRDNSVQCAVTSPPYWGLRKYDGNQDSIWDGDKTCSHDWQSAGNSHQRNRMNAPGSTLRDGKNRADEEWAKGASMLHPQQGNFCVKCGAWRGSFGLEPSLQMYIDHTVIFLREIRRVLKPDGDYGPLAIKRIWGDVAD